MSEVSNPKISETASRTFFLTTARLGFSRWTREDYPLAKAMWGDPAVTRFISQPFSDEQVRERLELEIARMTQFGVQYWPVFLLDSGEHVGCAGLRPYRQEERVRELGVHLRPKFWGMGLAEEAGRALIDYAFGSLGTESLMAGRHPQNLASRRLLEKFGFCFMYEELYEPTGLMHPWYRLVRPEPA